MKSFWLYLTVVAALCLSACSNPISSEINEAFQERNDGKTRAGIARVQKLVDKVDNSYSVYDIANIAIAAMTFAIDCDDSTLGEKGLELAKFAWQKNPQECNKMIEEEGYSIAGYESFDDAVHILYDGVQTLKLKAQIVGKWQTNYNHRIGSESQEYVETISLNPDGTFLEEYLIHILSNDGDYEIKADVNSSVSGEWILVGDELTLSYNDRTLQVSIVPNTFKMSISGSAFFNGGNIFDLAFDGAFAEDEVKKELVDNVMEMTQRQYQSGDIICSVSINKHGNLRLSSIMDSHTYIKQP